MELLIPVAVIVLIVIFSSIRQINEYERGIKFRFGKFAKIIFANLPNLNLTPRSYSLTCLIDLSKIITTITMINNNINSIHTPFTNII